MPFRSGNDNFCCLISKCGVELNDDTDEVDSKTSTHLNEMEFRCQISRKSEILYINLSAYSSTHDLTTASLVILGHYFAIEKSLIGIIYILVYCRYELSMKQANVYAFEYCWHFVMIVCWSLNKRLNIRTRGEISGKNVC